MHLSWLTFLGLIVVLTITPGPDVVLVMRAALTGGWRTAARTVAGIALGLSTWALAAAFGVAALIAASTTAFTILKLAGAAYLAFLGLRALIAARAGTSTLEAPADAPPVGAHAFRRGLVTNLLNPKIGVFYTAFLPQFVDRDASAPVAVQVLVLAAVQIAVGCSFQLGLAAVVVRAGGFLRRPAVARTLDAVAGVVLIAFALRLVLVSDA